MKKTNFFDRLSRATETYRQQLYQVPQLVDGLQGRISRETYIAYLTEAYHHVKHTVPLLMAMGGRLPSDKQWLQEAVAAYIDEEKGHEQWILNDIEAAGGDREQTRYAAPRLETQILVAYNYDYIARKNPIGFFGMVFMLESTSVQIATQGAESVQVSLGLPDDAFSYLNSHGSLDQEHLVFFKDLMRKIGDPQDQGAIIEVAQNTFQLFASVLRSIPHTETVRDVA